MRLPGVLFGLFLGVSGAVVGRPAAAAEAGQPKQGAALLKTDLLGVFAHPDDETGVAPLIAHYALGKGLMVSHVYCTRGEGGGNMVGTQAGPALGLLREAELRDCLQRLGVRHCYFLDREDFAYTESAAITLEKWGHEETLARLVRLVRALRPEVIVTMNPAPTPGQHGNHQVAGWLAIEAFSAAADPARFPEQIQREGLRPWQARKLYHGGVGPFTATLALTNPLPNGRLPALVAGEALSNHRSQAFGNFGSSPWFRRPQQLQLVQSVVPFLDQEEDLFRGLPLAGDTPRPVFPELRPSTPTVVPVRFLPRPAVSRYQDFLEDQRIRHTATAFDPDIPVVAGERTPVSLEILDNSQTPAGELTLQVPDGWTVEPRVIPFGGPNRRSLIYRILQVTAPANATDGELVASGAAAGSPVTARARLHPVPRLTVPRRSAVPALDGSDEAWARLPGVPISHTNTWQGQADGPADASGEFRVTQDGQSILVEVRVRDDRVVSNIEPDDIKGHWRSDSIELCFDPHVGSEHTLGGYKLGVFPFDTTGRVRGARDADAVPGLVEETAPGTRLWSRRTPDGYVIRAAIPLREIGFDREKTGGRLGFNVLIYDGDKADAAPGENINKVRLAWTPRSGVQGRPEDWGRLDLE